MFISLILYVVFAPEFQLKYDPVEIPEVAECHREKRSKPPAPCEYHTSLKQPNTIPRDTEAHGMNTPWYPV